MARRTKEEALATRSSILDAAEQLFQRQGVSRTSLQDIATAAGVTRGAVYWHFKDKGDVVTAMMDRVILPMERAGAGLDAVDGGAVLPALRALLLDVCARVTQDARVHRVLEIALYKLESVDELSAVRDRRLQMRHDYRARLERALQRGQARGEVSQAVPAAQLAIGLHALLDGLIQNWLLEPASFDLQAVGASVIDVHLAGMAAASGPGLEGTRPPPVLLA